MISRWSWRRVLLFALGVPAERARRPLAGDCFRVAAWRTAVVANGDCAVTVGGRSIAATPPKFHWPLPLWIAIDRVEVDRERPFSPSLLHSRRIGRSTVTKVEEVKQEGKTSQVSRIHPHSPFKEVSRFLFHPRKEIFLFITLIFISNHADSCRI